MPEHHVDIVSLVLHRWQDTEMEEYAGAAAIMSRLAQQAAAGSPPKLQSKLQSKLQKNKNKVQPLNTTPC